MSESTPKPPRKEFRHPVLSAMGISRLRVPSRNWMIFWAVSGLIAGTIAYDRRERKLRREHWKDKVRHLSMVEMNALEMPRKVNVYIAPPPGDYMETSMAHFRHYIKPILVASATDYELHTLQSQGDIRYQVAEEIRNRRRRELGLPEVVPEGSKPKDEIDAQIESKLKYDTTGGVICVGRGAYTEYMNGLHEGWLGPLEKPEGLEESDASAASFPNEEADLADIHGYAPKKEADAPAASTETLNTESSGSVEPLADKSEPAPSQQESDISPVPAETVEKEEKKEEQEEKKKEDKVAPKSYIPLGQWDQAESNTQFLLAQQSKTVSEPIAIIPHSRIMGFLNTPIRIYRWFNKRHLADSIGEATVAVVFASTRPYDMNTDPDALISEVDEWPKNWKKKGIEKGSEWMAPFKVDERIGSSLSVYTSTTEQDEFSSPSSSSE
uniref:Mitochondrial import inner membrane translocase subunit TIM54 n=1 Tax=Blastobotrys adeninivorans TaxID=409370 RepID=A0A060TG51_BLAAD